MERRESMPCRKRWTLRYAFRILRNPVVAENSGQDQGCNEFCRIVNGHGLLVTNYIQDDTKLQEGPYIHCKGSLNKTKTNTDSSSHNPYAIPVISARLVSKLTHGSPSRLISSIFIHQLHSLFCKKGRF